MIETIFICSIPTFVFTACIFIYTISSYGDNKQTAKKIVKLEKENRILQEKLSNERSLRIKAEQNESFYADKFFLDPEELNDLFKPF